MSSKPYAVDGTGDIESQGGMSRVNKALKHPECLTSADGRQFWVVSWRPVVEHGCEVTAELKVVVAVPDE